MFVPQPRMFRNAVASSAQHSVASLVVDLVATEFDVPKALMVNHSRCRANVAKARQVAMYLTHVVFGEKLVVVADAFGRDRTTVSYACGLIEDLRDDPQFDAQLDRLERVLTELAHA